MHMMRRLLCILPKALTLLTLAVISQQSRPQSAQALDNNRSEWAVQTATVGARVRVTITKHKPKLHLARPQQPLIWLSANDDDTDYYDELPDLQVGYRRPEIIDQTAKVYDDISDEIKIRLLLARKRALEAYHVNWS
jgi:hypothetical protein